MAKAGRTQHNPSNPQISHTATKVAREGRNAARSLWQQIALDGGLVIIGSLGFLWILKMMSG